MPMTEQMHKPNAVTNLKLDISFSNPLVQTRLISSSLKMNTTKECNLRFNPINIRRNFGWGLFVLLGKEQ